MARTSVKVRYQSSLIKRKTNRNKNSGRNKRRRRRLRVRTCVTPIIPVKRKRRDLKSAAGVVCSSLPNRSRRRYLIKRPKMKNHHLNRSRNRRLNLKNPVEI
jgi:hypothetical protein